MTWMIRGRFDSDLMKSAGMTIAVKLKATEIRLETVGEK